MSATDDSPLQSLETKGKNVEIATFAFIDLETTGLPDTHPCITELSLACVSRDELQNPYSNNTPRIIHKLTRVFNPQKSIGQMAFYTTGNDLQEDDTVLPQVLKLYSTIYHLLYMCCCAQRADGCLQNTWLNHLLLFCRTA